MTALLVSQPKEILLATHAKATGTQAHGRRDLDRILSWESTTNPSST